MKIKLLVFIFLFLLNACSSDKNIVINKQLNNDVEIYNSGLKLLKKRKFNEAIERFTELEIQYPYSDWSARGQMLIGFSHYSNREYDEAILSLSKFTELNPDHPLVPYAIFLKGYSYYERIPNIELDQEYSEKALQQFLELTNRYPNSKYKKKSFEIIKILRNHLSSKELLIGKFYQSKGNYLAAIKRYKQILKKYKRSVHTPESLFRLVESYTSIGLVKQANYLYKILSYNFPKSSWKKEGDILAKKYKINTNLKKYKKQAIDLNYLKDKDFELF
ncbi:MAG: outer membrane protein assembly factor BamD [Alphaproteobacteria bacterium]